MDALVSELQRRQSNTEKVIAIFEDMPRAWLSWTLFADAVGERAYRTRISNAKKRLEQTGRGTIESRTFKEGPRIITEYRFIPAASEPSPDRWTSPGAPYGPEPFELVP